MTNTDLTTQLEKAIDDAFVKLRTCIVLDDLPAAYDAWKAAVDALTAHRAKIAPKAEEMTGRGYQTFMEGLAKLHATDRGQPTPSAAPPECRPPSEHEGERWHWLCAEHPHETMPVEWTGKGWKLCGVTNQPTGIYASGWRYLAPCSTPASVARPSPEIEFDEAVNTICSARLLWAGKLFRQRVREILGNLIPTRGDCERCAGTGNLRYGGGTGEYITAECDACNGRKNAPSAPTQEGPTLSQALLPCPICRGVEGCDHSVSERMHAKFLEINGREGPTPTDAEIEIAAQAIYDDFEPPDNQKKPAWQAGGNSHKQTEARIYARSALTAALTRWPVRSPAVEWDENARRTIERAAGILEDEGYDVSAPELRALLVGRTV